MKVLHIAESALGGVGSYLCNLLPAQAQVLGPAAVRVIAPAEHAAQLARLPQEWLRLFKRPGRSLASLCLLAVTLQREVETFQPDVIHAHSTFAGLVVRLMFGLRPRRPTIVYCPHGWSFNIRASRWKAWILEHAERQLARLGDAIVAISDYEAEEARRVGIPPGSVRTILSGIPDIPAAPAADWNDQRLKVVFVGRLDRQKGFDDLLSAVGYLQDEVCVRVAGVAVTDRAGEMAVPANVDMLGWLSPSQIDAQIRAADMVVVPSRWEGFGLVAAEAMRAGRAVIASDVGGLPEVVEDGVTGMLIPPDRPDCLGAALTAHSRSELRLMGVRGRARFLDRFTDLRMRDETLQLYVERSRVRTTGEHALRYAAP